MAHWLDNTIGATKSDAEKQLYKDQVLYTLIVDIITFIRAASPSIPDAVVRWMVAQILLETGDFTSQLYRFAHNASGIRANNHGYTDGQTNGFAKYRGKNDWARDYIRIMQMKPAQPINATSATDFYNRLLKNGYFTKGEAANYLKNFNAKLKKYDALIAKVKQNPEIKDMLKDSKNPAVTQYAPKVVKTDENPKATEVTKGAAGQDPWYQPKSFLKKHPIAVGVGVALAGVLVIKAISKR